MQQGGVVGMEGVFSSVDVASGGGITRFFCAQWGEAGKPSCVWHSDDGGANWTASGTKFPAANAGRIALGIQSNNPALVYAFVADLGGALHGLFRLDDVSQAWKRVQNVPDVLPGRQGTYDLTVCVDPEDVNLIYLGGDRMNAPPWGGSIWRCNLAANRSGFRVASFASIRTHAHADIHHVIHTPGEPNELWCACDGGVFLNRDPKANGHFGSQNFGLACLCSNFIAQHPTDPSILFTGLQDNGTARTDSAPIWSHVCGGDGGYCLINWADPSRVLVYMNGKVLRSTTGGETHDGWSVVWNAGWATMTQPIVSAPYNPDNPADAELIAIGAGPSVYISIDFTANWPDSLRINLPEGASAGNIFVLTFASPTRLFIGTTKGRVYCADLSNNAWAVRRLDDAAAGKLGFEGLITDLAVDWADDTLNSIYLCFGGMGDRRRVWWFDGVRWEVRSGQTPDTRLLDVEHNALAVDSKAPNNIYVAADIGVWYSRDGGENWSPLENGLPDAPVFDLQIHPTQRLLRAATHGRGVYEIRI
jgi:hypothetical protein